VAMHIFSGEFFNFSASTTGCCALSNFFIAIIRGWRGIEFRVSGCHCELFVRIVL